MDKKLDNKFIVLMSLFFLFFSIFTISVLFNKPIVFLTKATEDISPSGETSLLLAWPLTIKADGKSFSTIDVFIRTKTNKPVSNSKVTLTTTLGLITEKVAADEDKKRGHSSFNITSETPGKAEITALINNSIPVKQSVSIVFE